ncbi:MAG: hypothetical protein K2Q03_05745 [Sphingobacteriaceae bacterium]|nr:hypothetical protein [Sphingobacteriaceae bacterium]
MATITKNQRSYDGGDVIVSMLGIFDIYADSIDYSTKREHQRNYGLGRKARSWSMGKEEYEGKISLMMEDVVAIQSTLDEGKSLIDLQPFSILVTFSPNADGSGLAIPVVDKIVAKFQATGRKIDNSMGLKYEYELFVIDIQENVKP